VALGSIVLIGSTLLPWWRVGGEPGELTARGDIGISDARGLLIFLAAVACLLLATVRWATNRPIPIDRPVVYLGLFATATGAWALRVADLSGQGLVGWPPDPGFGLWFAVAGLAVLAGGVLWLFRVRGPEAAATEADEGDASVALDSEPHGRLDRLDALVAVGLLAALLAVRLFGLGQPTQMYFDETYHARTATEFLQEWRYGVPHDIYEWTHPMLAKYAMAGGIALAADDRVTVTTTLGVTVQDAVVQERTATAGSGDRVLIATGSEVRAYDLSTRRLVHTYSIPGVAALSDPTPEGLIYAGTADGFVYAIDTRSLDQLRADPTSSVAPAMRLAAATGISIAHAFAGAPPYVIVSDATGNVVSIDASGGAGTVVAGTVVARAIIPDAAAFAGFGLPPGPNGASAAGVLVAYRDGVAVLNPGPLTIESTIATASPATSMTLDPGTTDGRYRLYVAAGRSILLLDLNPDSTPTLSLESGQPLEKMPGAVTAVVFDEPTQMVHALGRTADGSGATVYAISVNGNAVFSDAPLPFEPAAMGLDNAVTLVPSSQAGEMPQADREELLVFGADGSMASIDVGQFGFSWRLPGVLAGAFMAVCLYLLARFLFKRRSVGLLVAFFSVVDGLLFAQSRIATNDTYAGALLVLAYLIFAALWLHVPRSRAAFWLGMPLLGTVLGLALATKWVALYAIGGIVLLILIRSALGRLVTILGLVAATGVLGWMSLAQTPNAPDFPFVLLMLAVTALAAAASAYRPVAWTRDELRFAVVAPPVLGLAGPVVIAVLLVPIGLPVSLGPLLAVELAAGAAGLGIGLLAGAAFWISGRFGFGPLAVARLPEPGAGAGPSPAAEGWLRPGWGFGVPAAWTMFCIGILPLVLYVALYVPWAMPWQPQVNSGPDATGPLPAIACWHTDATGTCDNAWPSGHTGQTLPDLTVQMYDYQNDLRATHAASSPWWAWPLDLKPVWFASGGSATGAVSSIHDGGNAVLWWMAIVGIAFAAWQALRRRSLALGLVAVAFFWQWLPWSRIDRATFEYHFYTALPFFLLGLAYFLAELWHGPSRRTWLLARVAVAGTLLLPGALWLLRPQMCGLAGVDASQYFGGTVCGTGTPDQIPPVGIVTAALLLAGILGSWFALRARNPRRLVLAICSMAALFFALDYPDLAGVWIPSSVQGIYSVLSPTWLYGFQFSTNLEAARPVQLLGLGSLGLVLVALLVAGAAAWMARKRRLVLEREDWPPSRAGERIGE
jgi:outer membrane protein assembly factor BamB